MSCLICEGADRGLRKISEGKAPFRMGGRPRPEERASRDGNKIGRKDTILLKVTTYFGNASAKSET